MQIQYRDASPSDVSALRRLLQELGYVAGEAQVLERLDQVRSQGSNIIVADLEGEAVGCVHVLVEVRLAEGCAGEIVSLVVTGPLRGSGIGKALLEEACAWLKTQACPTVRVRANAIRHHAHRFYASQGFQEIKTQKVFTKALGEPLLETISPTD
jgi:N-acetylglutamate synthase-like GNAT family acetyltransferase